ncbi:MAG TPA: hypothetical protein VFQ65_08155 [Kofleriaceae bacterium]|nr:hypothetical protein [Kofleriaceae bacterium]
MDTSIRRCGVMRAPEVHQHHAVTIKHHVARLEIAVDDVLCMRSSEPGRDLTRDPERVRDLDRPGREALRERLAGDVLHLHDLATVDLFEIERPAHVRMGDLLGEPDFVAQDRIVERTLHDLERDLLAELLVERAIDVPHTAFAEERFDQVAVAEALADTRRRQQRRRQRHSPQNRIGLVRSHPGAV